MAISVPGVGPPKSASIIIEISLYLQDCLGVIAIERMKRPVDVGAEDKICWFRELAKGKTRPRQILDEGWLERLRRASESEANRTNRGVRKELPLDPR
jgi:hypothetical protein